MREELEFYPRPILENLINHMKLSRVVTILLLKRNSGQPPEAFFIWCNAIRGIILGFNLLVLIFLLATWSLVNHALAFTILATASITACFAMTKILSSKEKVGQLVEAADRQVAEFCYQFETMFGFRLYFDAETQKTPKFGDIVLKTRGKMVDEANSIVAIQSSTCSDIPAGLKRGAELECLQVHYRKFELSKTLLGDDFCTDGRDHFLNLVCRGRFEKPKLNFH